MIKYIFILIFVSGLCYSQKKDTTDIAFKAKLLTVNRHGISEGDKLLKDITNQKLEFIEYNDSSNWMFMKIEFDQKYGDYIEDHSILWLGECYFYIAFKNENSKFYRLGGFDTLDLDDFINDIHNDNEYLDFLFNKELNNEISINCIESYVKLSNKKRLKQDYECFKKCSEVLNTTLIVN